MAIAGSALRTLPVRRDGWKNLGQGAAVHEQQNQDDDQQKAQPTARVIAPACAIWPSGQCSEQEQKEKNNEEQAKHRVYLRLRVPSRYQKTPARTTIRAHRVRPGTPGAELRSPCRS